MEEAAFELAPEGYIGVHAKLRVWIHESGFQVEGTSHANGSFEKPVNMRVQ